MLPRICCNVTLGHVHTVTSYGDSDGGTPDSTLTVWQKDDWAPDLTDKHWLDLTFTKGLLPGSKQENFIQHKIPSCQKTPRAILIKHSEAIPRAQLR